MLTQDWNTANEPYCSEVKIRVNTGVKNKAIPLLITLPTVYHKLAFTGAEIFLYLFIKFFIDAKIFPPNKIYFVPSTIYNVQYHDT